MQGRTEVNWVLFTINKCASASGGYNFVCVYGFISCFHSLLKNPPQRTRESGSSPFSIGKLDHLSHVRDVGGVIGMKDYFGPKQKSTESLSQKALRKLEVQMTLHDIFQRPS